MINKNFYRKTNDKKILHKVGKQWKVVSVALLMAIGGTAVATHVNANAASTNDENNAATNSLVTYLNGSAAANAPRFAQHATAKPASAKPSAEGIHYYPGSNGSAASYFDEAANESGTANKYYGTVNAYVQSLNNEYGPQVHSFATKSGSASAAAKNDSKLANSYSALNKEPSTNNTINSLANKNHMDPTLYVGMVQNNEEIYSNAVSSASNDVKANNNVASLVSKLENTNFSAASLNASASNVIAKSNLVAANDNLASVEAEFGQSVKGNRNAATFVDIARELSAGAKTLEAEGNPDAYNAEVGLANRGLDANGSDAVNSAIASATSAGVSSAKNTLSVLVSEANTNPTPLSSYASNGSNTFNSLHPAVDNVTDNNGDNISAAASEAVDLQFSTTLASVANSLYGEYHYVGYDNGSAAIQSAEDRARASSYAADFASANQVIVKAVSNDRAIYGAAGTAKRYLKSGVSAVAESLAYDIDTTSVSTNNYGPEIDYTKPNNQNNYPDPTAYANALQSKFSNSTGRTIIGQLMGLALDFTNHGESGQHTESGVASAFSNAATALSNVHFAEYGPQFDKSDLNVNNNNASEDTIKSGKYASVVNAASHSGNEALAEKILNNYPSVLDNAISHVTKNHEMGYTAGTTTLGTLDKATSYIGYVLNSAAGYATTVTATRNGNNVISNGLTNVTAPASATVFDEDAALLSDGVDLDQLNAESGAIANVANATNSALGSVALKSDDSNAQLSGALNVASASANSALTSAQTASGNYSAANDEDVTLSSYFASSYATDASDEANASTNASSGLNSFFISMADDNTFANADDAYNDAKAAENNDYKLGVANAKSVYNRSAHFLDVLKGASLHTTPNFNTGNDKVVAHANKGDRLTVYGVNVSRNNNWRGVVRYFVLDNTTGKKGFITGQPAYTKAAYLSAVAEHQDVQVKTLKPVRVFSDLAGKKYVGTVPAGKVLNNADVVYANDTEDAHGFTKVETTSDDFLTANTDYVAIVVPNVNNNNNNNVQPNYNYNLNNGQLNFDKYFNTYTED